MAVVIGTRNSFELVDGAGVEDVALGTGLRPGPRVLRRFAVPDRDRRPSTRRTPPPPRAPSSPRTPQSLRDTPPDAATCRVRPERHPAVQFTLCALATAALAAALTFGYLYASGATTVPERTAVVHVQVGETLHDLAERSAPTSDPDAVAARIRTLNNLTTDDLTPGQPLTVPTSHLP
ncbi:LysM peptidoglycan-binding domain-containing protein [Saccharothrix xinjiangensis]|uniref:LysM peptidoglycan-binding domain-containing protein n=1 Tax=Saccharothrix xinjiangensis TaxID=204798 RepID=A0ABV9XUZ4_9PSEU